MLGKTVAIGLLILGTFILANFLLRIGSSLTSPSEDTLSAYHLGCYDCDHPLNQSTHIQHYLLNLSSSLSQHSVS